MRLETCALGKEASNRASNSFSFPSLLPRPGEIDEFWQVKMCTLSCFADLESGLIVRFYGTGFEKRQTPSHLPNPKVCILVLCFFFFLKNLRVLYS